MSVATGDRVSVATGATDVPRTGLLAPVQAVVTGLNGALAVLSALAIAAAGCVLTWEVVGRYFLGIASDWQDELSTFLLIGATFGSAAWTQARRGHVGIDALAHVLPPAVDAVRRVLADVCSLLFVGLLRLEKLGIAGGGMDGGGDDALLLGAAAVDSVWLHDGGNGAAGAAIAAAGAGQPPC